MKERKKPRKIGPKQAVIAAILTALEYRGTEDCQKVLDFINDLPVNGDSRKNNGGIKE